MPAQTAENPPLLPPLSNLPVDERIWIIENSLGCLRLGAWSLLPGVGLPLSLMGLVRFWVVGRVARGRWNPARGPLVAGAAFSMLGLWISMVELAILLRSLGAEEALVFFLVLCIPLPIAGWVTVVVLVEKIRDVQIPPWKALFTGFAGVLAFVLLALLFSFIARVILDEFAQRVWNYTTSFAPVLTLAFTVSYFLWCCGSLTGGSMNDSFGEYPRRMFIWFALASGSAIYGMMALADMGREVVAVSLMIPLALLARLFGAVFSAKVRAAILASLGLHLTWLVLSVPFLGAAAFELGWWHRVRVGGVSLFDFWRSLW